MWITPVIQKVQETRLNQLADRAKNRSKAVGQIQPGALDATHELEQEVLDEETRHIRAHAAWRYAMRRSPLP